MQPQYAYPQQQGYPPGMVAPPPQGYQPGVAVGIPMQQYPPQQYPPQQYLPQQQVMIIPMHQQQVVYQPQHQVIYSHGASREDPQDYIAGFVFTMCCGIFGIICYACSNTQYYLNGFLSGMGLWLIAYGVLILAIGASASNAGSITVGVLMFIVGVPLMTWSIYRKREQDRIINHVINVQPAMGGGPGVVVIQQQNGFQ